MFQKRVALIFVFILFVCKINSGVYGYRIIDNTLLSVSCYDSISLKKVTGEMWGMRTNIPTLHELQLSLLNQKKCFTANYFDYSSNTYYNTNTRIKIQEYKRHRSMLPMLLMAGGVMAIAGGIATFQSSERIIDENDMTWRFDLALWYLLAKLGSVMLTSGGIVAIGEGVYWYIIGRKQPNEYNNRRENGQLLQ